MAKWFLRAFSKSSPKTEICSMSAVMKVSMSLSFRNGTPPRDSDVSLLRFNSLFCKNQRLHIVFSETFPHFMSMEKTQEKSYYDSIFLMKYR